MEPGRVADRFARPRQHEHEAGFAVEHEQRGVPRADREAEMVGEERLGGVEVRDDEVQVVEGDRHGCDV